MKIQSISFKQHLALRSCKAFLGACSHSSCEWPASHQTLTAQEAHPTELSEATQETERNQADANAKLQKVNAMEILLDHTTKYARTKKCCQTCARPLNPAEMQQFLQKQVSFLLPSCALADAGSALGGSCLTHSAAVQC